MDIEVVKKGIETLINDFKANYNQYKHELEANTETKLVEPLFALLGWNKNDFTKRETARRGKNLGFGDYAFKIDGRIVFFLEVKKVGIPLEKEADKQVISYALSKRIPFAVSTNFEQLKIFCVEQENATSQVFRVFKSPEDYITNIQNLLLLSKESFEKNLILKEAENEGRLKKRISINKILLDDLMYVRKLIVDDVEKTYPKKYEINEKEEIVQRIIDRLIFIRRCEDLSMNPENLYLEEITHLPDNKAYPKLKEMFDKYNQIYNSGLFAVGIDNDCDIIKVDGLIIKRLIGYLYESKDKQYIYNFDWIDADVLGQVYEQYLGNILQQTKSGKSKLKDGQAHRKESGIFYTPTYVVDYIVKNTILETLNSKKIKPQEIKVLDCACGSGSFLIKAFDYLYENLSKKEDAKQHRLDSQGMYSVKTKILKKNLYGVDLDNKAVEITKLNLLLKASEKNRKLPEEVDLHIKRGNSLIDDENVAPKDYFKWDKDFKEGSFDVVIGNPPYIRVQTANPSEKDYLSKKYLGAKGKYDLYILFIEKALNLLKEDGLFGFIVPNKFTQTKYGEALKEYILQNYTIEQFIDFGDLRVFEEATTYPCIIIIKKRKVGKKQGKYVKIKKLNPNILQQVSKLIGHKYYNDNNMLCFDFRQKNLNKDNWSFMPEELQNIYDKMVASSNVTLKDLTKKNIQGFITGDNESFIFKPESMPNIEQTLLRKIPKGKNVQKYVILDEGLKVLYTNSRDKKPLSVSEMEKFPKTFNYLNERATQLKKRKFFGKQMSEFKEWWQLVHPLDFTYFEKPKIITPNLSSENRFMLDEEGFFVEHDCYIIILKNDDLNEYKYILALLNSKAVEFFFKQKSPMFSGGYYKYHTQYLNTIPIPETNLVTKNKIVSLVNTIIKLKKMVLTIGNKQTSEKVKLQEEINKIDEQINQEVYKLYGITKEEQKIIEESSK